MTLNLMVAHALFHTDITMTFDFFFKNCALELILPLPTATGFRFRDLKANSVVLNLGFGLQVSCYE